ncbi:MAG: TolC family protein [Gemmataceae bacterium]|nr:TolC family protein [Gemmataceae bacterium]MDW8263974.1 TolC family protein [Gemmataceae bacterium]
MGKPERDWGRRQQRRWPTVLAGLWAVGLPALLGGCRGTSPCVPPVVADGGPPEQVRAADDELPPPRVEPSAAEGGSGAASHVVPISLDTVLRLAEEQNAQIAIARERVREACAESEAARHRWIPDLWVGAGWYRHEGGIQNPDGTFIRASSGALFVGPEMRGKWDWQEWAYQRVSAERRARQQKGELHRITSETLLEAASTYIDLLAARTGEAIALEQEAQLKALLERSQKVADVEPGARVEVHRVETELLHRRWNVSRLREQAAAASAKLVYLLGLDPSVELVPLDARLDRLELVDPRLPLGELIARTLSCGPGMAELAGLLTLVHEGLEQSHGIGPWLPVVELRMAEGGFGAGPGSAMTWDNRWDLGLQARWNLTQFLAVKERRQAAAARLAQLHLTCDDLKRKLVNGVTISHQAIQRGREQIDLSQEQIRTARQAYEKSRQRMENNLGTTSEVLLSLQALAAAQLNYLSALRDYDKNQLRLMLLVGPGTCSPMPSRAEVESVR